MSDEPQADVLVTLQARFPRRPGPHGEPWPVHLRRVLKRLLRDAGLRCVELRGLPPGNVDRPGGDSTEDNDHA